MIRTRICIRTCLAAVLLVAVTMAETPRVSDDNRVEVTPISVERRRSVRDDKLQSELARVTGGQTYELTTVDRLPDEIKLEPVVQHLTRNIPLWATPLWSAIRLLTSFRLRLTSLGMD